VKSRDEVSAGGVVYRRGDNGIEVLICKDSFYHRWSLPKGVVNKGETFEQAALREVREETGVNARIITLLGEPEKYVYTLRGVRVFKTVHYYLLEYVSGSEDDHDTEMEEVRWFPVEAAIETVAYKSIKEILRRAALLIEQADSTPRNQLSS
jgi:8-oxo-dGTP diphosphatase